METPSKETRYQVQRDRAAEALAKAYSVSVQFCKYACVNYVPQPHHDLPHGSYVPGFKKGDYIHIKEEYNDDWWIGRIVGPEVQVVFIPREEKLKAITNENSKVDQVYEDAPIMRPIVFWGPSLKSSKLTKFLQIPLITFMKDKFADRLVTESDHHGSYDNKRAVHSLEARVFQAGRSLNLVYLDCPISFPGDLDAASRLHPLYIYIQVSRPTVLQKLVRQITTSSRERGEMLDGADQLSKNAHRCDLLINESNLDDASQKLELFLEGYWAFTRSIFLT